MRLLNRAEIERLLTRGDGPRVSIYLPTHQTFPEAEQDPIRFKNLLAKAESNLATRGFGATAVQDVLAPGWALLGDQEFWRHQVGGLAVFLSSSGIDAYRLPLEVEELVVVQNRFHLKPLLPLLADLRFYVLALSQKAVRLFEGTRDSIREIDLHDIPEGLRDAVGYDWEQRSLQFHTGASGRAGARRPAMFHGHGAPKDDEKKEIATYLRQVDRGVSKILGRDTAPLILAAVQYLIPMYHRVSRYPNILDDGVVGNPETLSAGELHRRAWNMVQPKIQAAVAEAATRFDSLVRAGKASGDLEQVLRAAIDGRVDTLLVALGERAFGTYDADSRLETHPEPRRGDQDLLDLAALQALAQGGTVYAVARHEIPGGGLVAAIFRF